MLILHSHNKVAILETLNAFAVPLALVDVGPNGAFTFYALNAKNAALFGASDGEIAGRPIEEALGAVQGQRWSEMLSHCLEAAVAVTEDHHRDEPDGRRWYRTTLTPLHAEHGAITRIVATTVETTERHQAVDVLLDLSDRLELASRAETLGQLATGMLHELTDLMTVIGGHISLMQRRAASEETHHGHVEIRRACDRATNLIARLRGYSDAGPAQPIRTSVSTLIDNVMPLLDRLIPENIAVRAELGETADVLVDPGRLEQVVLNLAMNARDAMAQGGELLLETCPVEVSEGERAGWRAGAYTLLRISDTGTGMTPPAQGRAFDPLYTTKLSSHGSGMGLATVHESVTAAGGHVLLESVPGTGTTFSIYLPVEREEAEDPEGMPTGPARAAARRTILLVEDDHQLRGYLAMLLGTEGHVVVQAASGPEALRQISESGTPVDIVLSDVVMPAMSGIELADALRRDRPDLPVILMSGHIDSELVRLAGDREDLTLMTKPCEEATLLAALA